MKYFKISLVLLLLLSSFSFPAYAEDSGLGFRVEPIFPKSQIEDVGYYHFKGHPGETITLQARITNQSEEPLKVLIQTFNAYSSDNGIVYQAEPTLEGTKILDKNYQLKQHVTTPAEINLAPLESKMMEFTVNVPDINGSLLGSMQFRIFKGTKALTEEGEKSQLLMDEYRALNYTVLVDIRDDGKEPSLHVTTPHFSPEQADIKVPFENQHPAVIKNISGSYEITNPEDDTFTVKGTIPTFNMAPMTVFEYPYQLENATLRPGTYTVKTILNVDGHKQTFKEDITIENNALKEAQENDVEGQNQTALEPNQFPWMYVIIGILLIVIGVLVWILLKTRKRV